MTVSYLIWNSFQIKFLFDENQIKLSNEICNENKKHNGGKNFERLN